MRLQNDLLLGIFSYSCLTVSIPSQVFERFHHSGVDHSIASHRVAQVLLAAPSGTSTALFEISGF